MYVLLKNAFRANMLREQLQENLDRLKKFGYYNTHIEYQTAKRQIEHILENLKEILMYEGMNQHGLLCERFNEWYPSVQVDLLKIEILTNDMEKMRSELQEVEDALKSDYQLYKHINYLKSREKIYYLLSHRKSNITELLQENNTILSDWDKLLGEKKINVSRLFS